jgi:hypothetical protein
MEDQRIQPWRRLQEYKRPSVRKKTERERERSKRDEGERRPSRRMSDERFR